MSSIKPSDDDREDKSDSIADSPHNGEEDELGDVVGADDEEQSVKRTSLKERLAVILTPVKLGIGIAVLAMIVLGWWATRPIEAPQPPPKPPEPEELFAQQIEQILNGVSTQLHTPSYPIDDSSLLLIPFEELETAAEQRRSDLVVDESSPATGDVSSPEFAPLPPSNRFVGGGEAVGEPLVTELPKLDTVLIDEGVITDEGLKTIAKLPELRHLRLRLSPITDEGLKPLLECETLWFLNLPHSRLTEKGIRSLAALPKLRQLRVGSTLLGNDLGRALLEVESLRGLHLIGVPLGDEGLKVIVELPHLESLYLDDSAVTESGWEWLFLNHPQLHVHINQRHHDRDPHHHKHE
ncbi:adenylate cyclase [Rhodopirellula sp. P2]|uniref:adenylate cyclase n=1 Tax=Rhodopirellula sp. P2 TaxID=2127060 RepID=UPI0023679B70|nr:adenylate cyclase [Rhodopirellula sp. P2]WDQ19322.1 adenylate cyclase [Rhodopirellula sp. P2]